MRRQLRQIPLADLMPPLQPAEPLQSLIAAAAASAGKTDGSVQQSIVSKDAGLSSQQLNIRKLLCPKVQAVRAATLLATTWCSCDSTELAEQLHIPATAPHTRYNLLITVG